MNSIRCSAFAVTFLAIVMILPCEGQPGSADASAAHELTGGGSREWVFLRIDTMMGQSDHCTAGETYRFNRDHSAEIVRCINGRLKRHRLRWSLAKPAGSLDPLLNLGGRPYVLLFRRKGVVHLMRLRTPSTEKTQATIDREFRWEED